MKTNSKLRRMAKVLSLAFVIFIQIYWYKLRNKTDAEWEVLWGKIGKKFRETLFELEGLLIKVGQLLSIRADLLPKSFIQQIQDLTDHVPPSEWKEIEQILEQEWGSPIEEHLQWIEKKAVASASIGEVYKGVLINGEEVAIKVQRTEIESIVQTDFRTLRMIIWFAADHFVPVPKGFINFKVLFDELKQVIERELDFSKEKDTLLSFQKRFKDVDIVKIPEVYSDYCSSKVLVMEWMEGIRVTDESRLDQLEISRTELAKRLIEIFLPQWLEPGLFHADPHAGNVLISEDGHIILLDFGMIGEISKRDAANFQGLIESMLSKNFSKAVECLTQLGFLLPEADKRTMEKLLAEMMSFEVNQWQDMDLFKFKLEMNNLIQALPIQVPTRFVFLGRSFVTLEGMIYNLAPEEEFIVILKPAFTNWIKKQGNHGWSFVWHWLQSQPLFKLFYSFKEFLTLPQKLEDLKEKEQRRQFQFTIYENGKRQLFLLTLLSIGGVGVGLYSSHQFLMQFAIGGSLLSTVGYLFLSYQQKKWMKYMHEKRR
ncbi:ABC1 kinase family protein [Salinibacillus xinjiangensis]|uniref:ABC1 kinase family protein n=1 Tax=Salinibacillus xinjiangensis TaxID=1229268 RepID=UPI002B2783ED|nr:AarF/UbiB family protein [Salinibacillus xinjiangensis]